MALNTWSLRAFKSVIKGKVGEFLPQFLTALFLDAIYITLLTILAWSFTAAANLPWSPPMLLAFAISANLAYPTIYLLSLSRLDRDVLSGKLEAYLTKPNAFFYLLLSKIEPIEIARLIVGTSALLLLLIISHVDLVRFFTLQLLGFSIIVLIYLVFNILSIWTKERLTNIPYAIHGALDNFPADVYRDSPVFQLSMLMGIYFAFTAPIHAAWGTEHTSIYIPLLMAGALFILARALWEAGIRKYEGAGG